MDNKIRVTWQDLSVGRKLPWNVYTESGKLLLGVGHIIPNKQILNSMQKYVLYRDKIGSGYARGDGSRGVVNPFSLVENFVTRLAYIFEDIETGNKEVSDKLGRLVNDVIKMVAEEPDASIAMVHLPNNYPYSLFHSIQCAILCCLIAEHSELPKTEIQMLCAAALVANISMRDLQERLFIQGGKASKQQVDQIKQHPHRSVALVQAAGIENKLFTDIIMMHHERVDGSGYPAGLRQEEIERGALILAVADRYGAMVTMRDYREPISVKDSLKSFLLEDGKEYDQHYSLLLIKVLTVFPPGSFVRLQNGETAIVIRRGKRNPVEPILKSIAGVDGRRYSNPLLRDCSTDNYQITGVCGYDKNKPLNLSRMWDYI